MTVILGGVSARPSHLIHQCIYWMPLIMISAVILNGCTGIGVSLATYGNRSVAHKPELWGGYKSGDVYELKTDMFVMAHYGRPKGLALELTGSDHLKYTYGREQTGPNTFADYMRNPSDSPEVHGVVPRGSRVTVSELRKAGSLVWGQVIHVYAITAEGEFQGQQVDICDISEVSGDYKGMQLWGPDLRLLTRVKGSR